MWMDFQGERWKFGTFIMISFLLFLHFKSFLFAQLNALWSAVVYPHFHCLMMSKFTPFIPDRHFIFLISFYRCLWPFWCVTHRVTSRKVAMCVRRILSNSISESTDEVWETAFKTSFAENCFIAGMIDDK